MNKNHSLLIVASVLVSLQAHAGKFIAMPETGTGEIDVDDSYALPDGYDGFSDAYSISFVGGYKFDSNMILAANLSYTGTEVLFDSADEYSLDERGILVGYSFEINRNFRIVPMLGWSSWDLVTEEGALFNPGPEEELEFEGSDTYGRLNLEFPVTEVFQMAASYIYGEYDFGTYQTARVGFKFEF